MKIKHHQKLHAALFLTLALAPALRAVAQTVAPRALPPATEKKLHDLLAEPVVQQAHIGLSVMALGTAQTPQTFPVNPYTQQQRQMLFEVDGDKRFMPASNVKLYTAAIALHEMGPDKVFTTSVITNTPQIENGVIKGNLFLMGGGDPALSEEALQKLARDIAARGIKEVKGHVVAVSNEFKAETYGGRYPDGWTLDDALWYYGPEISALAFNRNQVDVTITGADAPGKSATVEINPPLDGLHIYAHVQTGMAELATKSSSELLSFNRTDEDGDERQRNAIITISGQVAPGQKIVEGVAIPNPPLMAGLMFKKLLAANGVQVQGQYLSRARADAEATYTPGVPGGVIVGQWPQQWTLLANGVLASYDSPPLRVLLQRLLKNSDNLYAEMLLRDAALHHDRAANVLNNNPQTQTGPRAHALMFEWLRNNNIDTTGLRFTDGSGLSRYNLITPRATAQLLAAVDQMPGGQAFWDALPIAGVDGTMKNRMRSTPLVNNARTKSGTFSIVSALSGYVTTRDGHRLAVSLLTNFAPDGTAVRNWQDRVYTALAEADWSTPAAN